ncbi:MAG: tRNA pseudouridine(38-40) synthase TruA [Christensenellaceae bacterium]|nr:tRNA pseudouridine(38-40) synthase TruA [Christensenellaceae bacterium]MEA5068636.1 tRNA pseudouridine(38-40) synthase TruA [Christensenellaceae bacterium]
MRIKLTISYDGTGYAGWQRQENALSVQQVVEDALTRLTGARAAIVGASRTDAGVHALAQAAHFDTDSRIPPDKFAYALNTMLPPDVRVTASEAVDGDFHARFSATGKRYAYRIWDGPHASAIYRNLSAHVIYPLDTDLMHREALSLVGRHDFAAFAASGSAVKDTVRDIYACAVARGDDGFIVFTVRGKGFLYNMVRIAAGTLIAVGSLKLAPGAVGRAIQSRDRLDLGPTAPAKGLTLVGVEYGNIVENARSRNACMPQRTRPEG